MNAKEYGLLLALLSPILSSMATIFQSGSTKLLTPLLVASASGVIGGIAILAYLSLFGRLPSWSSLREQKKDIILVTFLRIIAGTVLFVYGLSMTTGIKAIFFTKAEAYLVLLWFWTLEKGEIRKSHLLLLSIHMLGALLLSTGGVLSLGTTQLGDLLIIGAVVFFSLSYMPSARLSKSIGARQTNGITLLTGGLILFPFAALFSRQAAWNPFSLGWGYMLAAIILFHLIALTMWFASLKTVKGWMVSALRAVGPLVGAPFAFLLLGETLSPVQVLGAAVVLATSALIAKEHLRGE